MDCHRRERIVHPHARIRDSRVSIRRALILLIGPPLWTVSDSNKTADTTSAGRKRPGGRPMASANKRAANVVRRALAECNKMEFHQIRKRKENKCLCH